MRVANGTWVTMREIFAEWGFEVNADRVDFNIPVEDCEVATGHFHAENIHQLLDSRDVQLNRSCSSFKAEGVFDIQCAHDDIRILEFTVRDNLSFLHFNAHKTSDRINNYLIPKTLGMSFSDAYNAKVKEEILRRRPDALKSLETYSQTGEFHDVHTKAPLRRLDVFPHRRFGSCKSGAEETLFVIEVPKNEYFPIKTLLRSLYLDLGDEGLTIPGRLIKWIPLKEAAVFRAYCQDGARYLRNNPGAVVVPSIGGTLLEEATPLLESDDSEVLEAFKVFRQSAGVWDALNAARAI